MKETLLILLTAISAVSCQQNKSVENIITEPTQFFQPDTADMTNNFYDNTETFSLPVSKLTVEGEVENPGEVDLSQLPVHSLIVKETLLDSSGTDRFVGAYRYDGYSLFDILNRSILRKVNRDVFSPIIDAFIEVENSIGEKVVFSWGEIYYPVNLHRIIIASSVSRIVPSKTNDLWKLPAESRVIAGNDLITERNISSPVKITVRSFPAAFEIRKGASPLYSKQVRLYENNNVIAQTVVPDELSSHVTYNTIFYGRGRGIHSTQPFSGFLLKEILQKYYPFARNSLREGIMCIAGADGYRCAVSYSELFNRNDQQEFLLVKTTDNEDGGQYRIFPAADFFSDRAIKSVSEIHLNY